MKAPRGRTLLVTLSVVVTTGCALLLVGPRALGGPTSILAVSGNSMEPRIEAGDLILVRAGGPYHVGQIVAYHNIPASATFLHRIVALRGTGFAMKGDHNGWIDPGTAQPEQVVGRLWIRIPGAGWAFRWVATPLHGALLAAAAAFLIGWRDTRRRRRRRRGTGRELDDDAAAAMPAPPGDLPANVAPGPWAWRPPPPPDVPVDFILKATLAAALIGAAACAFLGVVSFTRPTSVAGQPAPLFHQSGTLAYRATAARSAVYPTGAVTSPTPLYLHLVKAATFSFRYQLAPVGHTDVSGSAQMRLVLQGSTGWQRVLAQTPPRPIQGTSVTLRQRVSIARLRSLLTEVQLLTASPDSYTLAIAPVVVVHGAADGRPFVRRFTPHFSYVVTDAELTPAGGPSTGAASVLSTSALATTTPPGARAAHLTVGPVRLPVRWWRVLAVVLGAAMLGTAGAAAVAANRRLAQKGEPALIGARHRDLLVPLALAPADGERHVTVRSFEDLLRVARRHETTVMHHGAADGSEHYVVLADGIAFRYRSQPAGADPEAPRPVRAPDTDAA